MTLADQPIRDRICNDLGTTLLIEAAAGTGKTTELVNRIVSVISSGRTTLERIVAVTFTEPAAGELKLRLREKIESAQRDPTRHDAERQRLHEALKKLEEAQIGTIHSFCAELIRERPVEAGVDPLFGVAAEETSGQLLDRAFERWFAGALSAPGEALRRIIRRRELADNEGPRPVLRAAARELLEWRDFDLPWQRQNFARESEIDALIAELVVLGELAHQGDPEDWLRKSLEEIGRRGDQIARLDAIRGARDYDAAEAALLAMLRGYTNYWGWRGGGQMFGSMPRAEMIARRDALHARLEAFRDAVGADLAPKLRDELAPVVVHYQELKNRAGLLDFVDLLLFARRLIRDSGEVRAALQKRISHIFIDEFQDTDPLQAEILLLLACDDPAENDWRRARPIAGKLFIVGDPKQSIYRFRRTDVALYQEIKHRLIGFGAALEHLTVSFRAVPEIQQLVNAAFAPLMPVESRTQPAYSPLEPSREGFADQPPIVVLPVPEPYADFGRITKRTLDESLPNAVAAFIKWLIDESRWTVTERDHPSQRVKISPRHICILFRRLNAYGRDVARPYARGLEVRHVPHVLVKGGSFSEREEVEAIRNALGAIERPDDEMLVFATLRGPLFALSDGALLQFRETIGSLHPFRRLPDALPPELREVAAALEVLRGLHRGRNRRPLADTIARLLAATRAHASIAIWPTGQQALANVMRLMDQARRHEARAGATSFRGFVDELDAKAESEEAADAPVVEQGTEGVRIMTVHRAKGLEFPIVILADLTCNETAREPRRFVDPECRLCAMRLAGFAPRELLDNAAEELRRETEEAVRILYVAATRARDLIVVPAVGDAAREGWIGKLNPVIYPSHHDRRAPLTRHPPACPQFGDDSVRMRPDRAPGTDASVAPGLHRAGVGEHQVVWWDPSLLKLDVKETMGLRQTRLLEIDENAKSSTQSEEAHRAWQEHRASLAAAGATPTIRVATATELAAATPELGASAGITIEEVPRAANRPHGARFGTLVHATLMRIAFDADRDAIAKAAELQARMLGASAEETGAAIDAVTNAIGSPLLRVAARSSECRRECAVLHKLDDGVLLEGVADLAFIEHGNGVRRWCVVDFKTDIDISARLDEYRAQLSLYMRAIAASTRDQTRGVLLWI